MLVERAGTVSCSVLFRLCITKLLYSPRWAQGHCAIWPASQAWRFGWGGLLLRAWGGWSVE